ncbi:hypothetical protein BOTCAL_0161g00170 [Botryotinia calthae]|uniref:Glucose-methanol-choline oxidoreductase N-terminal domain-containing protein n=1 Tax=Botryotinia calthae TaxID=38488 RepID=A0A4Y8D3W7_9HELO|nr:hypothetical protein BOTCAL_0161g00170 [Botryotinia calthae]
MWWPLGKKYLECHPAQVNSKIYDFVIVGDALFLLFSQFSNLLWISYLISVVVSGGTAGCTLASRLSEDPDISALVLECGPANDTWLSRNPLISSDPTRPTFGATRWKSEPMIYCDNRQSGVIRGEVLGGTSRINSMIYTRGTTADYDTWASLGHSEWSYEKHGIKVVHDLPGVGSTLTDHHSIPVAWEVPGAESLTSMTTSPLKITLGLFKYIFFQVGLFSIPVQNLALYVRSRMIKEDSTGLVEEVSSKSFGPHLKV